MKKTIFIVTSKLEEALNLGVKLDHLKKTNHSKTTVEHCLYPPGSIHAVKWSLNLRCNSIMILRDIPGKIKALVNLNKSRYMNKHSFEREYYKCLYELGHFYYLIMDNEDLDFAIEQELRFEGPPSLFVVYNMSKEQILLLLEQYPKTLKFKIIS